MNQFIYKNMKYPLYRVLLTLIGALIASIAINALYIPHNILSGGVTGIAILVNLKLGFNMSLIIIVINLPIFYIGYKMIHKEFILYSLFGMLALVVFLQLTSHITIHAESMLTTILLGGVMSGVGFGMIFRAGASTGGNDIISKILNQKYSYSISTFSFVFNLLIIALSVTTFGIDKAIETLTAMYVSSLTITYILEGANHKRTIFIITEKREEVAAEINKQLVRGCTILEGIGSYSQKKKNLLYVVISIHQVARLKSIVSEVDPNAFINVIETRVVFGKGFLDIKEN